VDERRTGWSVCDSEDCSSVVEQVDLVAQKYGAIHRF
jgi:hypothetical protein